MHWFSEDLTKLKEKVRLKANTSRDDSAAIKIVDNVSNMTWNSSNIKLVESISVIEYETTDIVVSFIKLRYRKGKHTQENFEMKIDFNR